MPNFRLLQVSSCLELTGELLRAEDVAALVECLPSVLKALIQIPSTCINAVKRWVHACCGACLLRCMSAAIAAPRGTGVKCHLQLHIDF